jgi:tetratricopeptide (TPR) repeat protein
MEVAEINWSHMMQVSVALQKIPRYHDLAWQAYGRGANLLEQDAMREPTAWRFATVASYRASLGNFAAADSYYRRALEMEPTNPEWRVNHAEVLRQLGRTSDAIEEVRTALRLHPDSVEAHRVLDQLMAASPRATSPTTSPGQP